ncbi:WG repeat-containing protein [Aggregatimonas sangjinii]|uniref:WG repeat-containing protein n=1 Tax=Aggregatimonas sangjinii TaxID=2583587 RepID=A0A5B7SKU4_9FLAO|nr:WG repeat-containing protein [Aggregatimonas sangjinii]QCW98661.1 WG repeat-containing protein [Aggregatimonas sangjinii]
MNKAVLLFFAFILLCANTLTAQELTPEMESFIANIDGTSLADIEAELDEGLRGLKAFMGFFDGGDSEGIKDYAGEEENFEEPFAIDTAVVAKAVLQFEDIGFQQNFRNGKSQLKFEKIGDNYWNTVWMEEGMAESFMPKTIYFKDGTKVTEGISDNEISFHFENPWGPIAIIDSVAVDYTVYFTAKYDSLMLTKKSKKIKYKEGLIKVKQFENNFLYVTVSDAYADGFYVNALNADGKVLNQNSSSFSPTTDDQAGDGIAEIVSLLEEIQVKLKNKDFKDTEAFKSYFLKEVSKLETAKDTDGVYHKKYYFEGNIDTVKLFIETEEKSKTVSFTAINNSGFGNIILMQDKKHNIFLDANAKELFRSEYRPIQSLGSRYYQSDSLYYHLDLEAKQLRAIDAFRVWEAPNGLAFVQATEESNFLMYDAEFKLLSDFAFEGLYTIDDTYVQGITGTDNFILDSKGTIKKLDGISDIRDPYYGRMAAKSNGKYGYLAGSGEVAIPFVYIDAGNFQDGLAIVAKETNKYGLIDTNGKVVIPLKYFGIQSFENGIVWVSTGDGHELLDKTGKVLVTAEGSSYSVSGSGLDKTYQFGDDTYDAFGRLLPKKEEIKD